MTTLYREQRHMVRNDHYSGCTIVNLNIKVLFVRTNSYRRFAHMSIAQHALYRNKQNQSNQTD